MRRGTRIAIILGATLLAGLLAARANQRSYERYCAGWAARWAATDPYRPCRMPGDRAVLLFLAAVAGGALSGALLVIGVDVWAGRASRRLT